MIRAAAVVCFATAAGAQTLPDADIYIVGEIHGHAPHHMRQADVVSEVRPTAVVFEHLTDEQSDRILPDTPRDPETLDILLDWSTSGWPDIKFYAPIMAASDAVIVGAAGAPGDLTAYDLDAPLAEGQQEAREKLQADAHCNALPERALPDMVAFQRATDAQFAARTLAALDRYGPPVVLVTGNGHARPDWGVPAQIAKVRPDLRVHTILQDPEGLPPEPGAPDPCDAFR